MDYKILASEILEAIGGKQNLASAAHCATRLRLVIADNNKVKKTDLENFDGVKGVFEASGQLQIILGTGTVNKVYAEFIQLAGIEAASKEDVKKAAAARSPWYKRAIKTLGDVFVPIIPAIVATGLLCGLLGGLSKAFPSMADSHLYTLLDMFSNAALTFLPILIAVSAAKIFGANIYLGAVIGMIMIHPNLVNAWSVGDGSGLPTLWSWFGLWNINASGYQGHVIPVVIAILLLSVIEKWLHKHVPEMFDLFVTPLVSVLVTGFLTMTVIGPVFAQLESWVLTGAQWLIALPFGIGSFVMGAVYAPTVVAGVHHMYNAIELSMLADNGQNIWMPIATAANVAQGAAALAVALKTQNKKIKSMALPASLSAFMGITEPAIFGVNVRFGKPLVAGMAGGACGAAVASMMNVYATANGVTGIFGFLITTDSFFGYLLTFAVAAVVAFVLSWILYAPTKEKVPAKEYKDNCVYSPMSGRAIALEEVPDKTFAEGTLGLGAAIDPMDGKVVAPADGKVSTLFDSHHAVGLTLDNGMELFVHIGMNTVELGGEGFDAYVKEGDRVSRGDTLITFDIQTLKNKGYSVISPVIITNVDDFKDIRRTADGGINYYDELITTQK
ncbi:PTS beta-glucoside transporter subunit IIBCA [Ruminococcus albus]|uniref:PTS system sucrose-specific IIA component, Glc family /PTS system sucrose-specific IIB component, Glc family /PTS system sucrose-specific IIC component, Glc family n=1 Tax=Ruminococcus albus TaxID=1264 RepID=A0A1H7GSC6_RUMAL|nr:PTS beta-glucoside transporter subunit IIBCA [Ruminococcus albus]SEK39530.1 PTS system sucrose-specific IIA component, Glc family /PTS system sucrose-specific IIB component, Glc family /PTS system sucrose-specific IIC component, Glc family [Ruminococcus albus]